MTIFDKIYALQTYLEDGATLKQQDGQWWLFDSQGNGIECGKNLINLIYNLIETKKAG